MSHERKFTKKVCLMVLVGTILCLTFSLGSAWSSKAKPGEGTTVQPARATWTTGFFLEALYSRGLEQLGYEVEDPKRLSVPIFYQALVNGEVDFWPNGWFPLHNEQLPDNFGQKCSKVGYVVKKGAIQGYLVSKKEVEKYDITSLNDFKREEVREAFDTNGDGKAELVACPPGWGCEKKISHHLDAYNLREYIHPIKSTYSASMASAITKYNKGQPVFFYTWTPNWTVHRLVPGEDVLWINVPKIVPSPGQKGLEEYMVAEGLEGAVTDPVKMGFVANDIRVAANDQFLSENPAAERLFQIISVPLEEIAQQNQKMYKGEDSQEDIERHATEWIKANQEKWNKWLDRAREAAAE